LSDLTFIHFQKHQEEDIIENDESLRQATEN